MWIKMSERKPTIEECDVDGYVVGLRGGSMWFIEPSDLRDSTHWMPFVPPIVEKKWRPATIQDLAAAGKPIPARFRDHDYQEWKESWLACVSLVPDESLPFTDVNAEPFKYCEVEDA